MRGIVIATNKSAVPELVAGARGFCEHVALAAVGGADMALCADKAYVLGCTGSRICCASALCEIVEKEAADIVLVEQNADGRYFAAWIAAKLGTCVLTDCMELTVKDGSVYSKKMSYGGKAIRVERSVGRTVVCVGSGVFDAAEEAVPCALIEYRECSENGITTIERSPKKAQSVNLSAAKKVVGVGRGIGSPENLKVAEELAAAIGAELACTRPIAEEEQWLPKERYIGVSGIMIKPALYIALGISGQIQHTVGINESGIIISVNKDKNSPIFNQSDYGIVGDVAEVLPKLIQELI